MTKRNVFHVTHRTNGDWQVKRTGASRASSVYNTKAEAVDRGRDLAKSGDYGQLVIHKLNGQIETEHTYGSDPYPPKG